VAALAARLPASSWYQRTVSEGTKGPITYALARQRVTLCKEGLPERTVWLVIKRTLGANPVYSYTISNAPVSTPLRTFVWLRSLRWAIEQCFEEGKTELGMAHYAVRKYGGWHHHMLTTMLAHFFPRIANLTRERSNGLLCAFLRVQKGTQCSRFLVPRCDVHDLKTPERVLLKLSLPS
jgi:hypothetical protein